MGKALMTKDDVKQLVEAHKTDFANVLPKHMTAERLARVALTAAIKTPKLLECTKASLAQCLLDCASLGVEPDGRNAHLIPYGNTCTLILDYKGMIELARNSGELSDWTAELVCDNDEFEYNMGQVTKHKIDFRQPRGEMYAVYSCALFKDGTKSFCVMQKDEVDAVRAKSKAGKSGPWVDWYNEMAKKTVIRRHSKTLPLKAEIKDAFMADFDTPIDITGITSVSDPVADLKPPKKIKKTEKKTEKKEAPPVEEPEDDLPYDDPPSKDALLEAIKSNPAGPIKRAMEGAGLAPDAALDEQDVPKLVEIDKLLAAQ